MPLTAAQFNQSLWPGIQTLFGMSYKDYPNEYTEIFDTSSSDKAFEKDVRITGFGEAGETPSGSTINFDTAQESYASMYVHKTYVIAFSITEEAEEDNQYESLLTRYTKAAARSMHHTKELIGANVLNNAFSGSYVGGDGVSLCSTAHPLISGTNSNRPTTGADLDETSLQNALIGISGWVDDRGLPIAAQGRKLIVPKENVFAAQRLLNTVLRVGTSDNDINAIKSMGMLPGGWTCNHRLTDSNAWFIKTDVPDGLKHIQRTPYKIKKEGDFQTGNLMFKARERYSFGWSDPLAIYGSPGIT